MCSYADYDQETNENHVCQDNHICSLFITHWRLYAIFRSLAACPKMQGWSQWHSHSRLLGSYFGRKACCDCLQLWSRGQVPRLGDVLLPNQQPAYESVPEFSCTCNAHNVTLIRSLSQTWSTPPTTLTWYMAQILLTSTRWVEVHDSRRDTTREGDKKSTGLR